MKKYKVQIDFRPFGKTFDVISNIDEFIDWMNIIYKHFIAQNISNPTKIFVLRRKNLYVVFVNKQLYLQSDSLEEVIYGLIDLLREDRWLSEDYWFLHGGSVIWNDKALILAGPSGSGKTTLAAFLHFFRNYGLLGDDLSPIQVSDYKIIACPTMLSIREPVVKKCREFYKLSHKSPSIHFNHGKRYIINWDCVTNWRDSTYDIHKVFFVKYDENKENRVKKLSRLEALQKLLLNSYQHTNMRKNRMSASALANIVSCYEIYHRDLESASEMIKALL